MKKMDKETALKIKEAKLIEKEKTINKVIHLLDKQRAKLEQKEKNLLELKTLLDEYATRLKLTKTK